MSQSFNPLRSFPQQPRWRAGDVVVIFGEVFQRGYVNGLIEEAKAHGAKLIYSTVGRRDEMGRLRALTQEELKEKDQPIINVPLEAGFDLDPAASGRTPVEQLAGLKLSEWQNASLDWDEVEESRLAGHGRFRTYLETYLQELTEHIPPSANVLFVHTMAGGVPRAKIIMPAMNRVFKGAGDRYASSEEFWQSDLGRLSEQNFLEVTALTLRHLIEMSAPLRERQARSGAKVAYVAYGYHGTEVLIQGQYQWQSYAPYLQGFAKLELERIAKEASGQGVVASVYNAPEILTNSSSIFLGVEVPLYPLLGALQKEAPKHPLTLAMLAKSKNLLIEGVGVEQILECTDAYFTSEVIKRWTQFAKWPQHNGPEQMSLMRETSDQLLAWHRDQKHLLTAELSEVVFRGCGRVMFAESFSPRQSVCWLGHDVVAQAVTANAPV